MRILSLVAALLLAAPALAEEQPVALSLTLMSGEPFDFADYRDGFLVVNYWATWCAPCIKEMPELSELHEAREDVTVIGLAYEDTPADELMRFLEQRPVAYPIAQIDVFDPPAPFGTPRGLPVTWVLGPGGHIVERIVGPVTRADLEVLIDRQIATAAP